MQAWNLPDGLYKYEFDEGIPQTHSHERQMDERQRMGKTNVGRGVYFYSARLNLLCLEIMYYMVFPNILRILDVG